MLPIRNRNKLKKRKKLRTWTRPAMLGRRYESCFVGWYLKMAHLQIPEWWLKTSRINKEKICHKISTDFRSMNRWLFTMERCEKLWNGKRKAVSKNQTPRLVNPDWTLTGLENSFLNLRKNVITGIRFRSIVENDTLVKVHTWYSPSPWVLGSSFYHMNQLMPTGTW